MSKDSSSVNVEGGGCGCFGLILLCLVMWALCFGVTWDGKHYGISCSCNRGVAIDQGN